MNTEMGGVAPALALARRGLSWHTAIVIPVDRPCHSLSVPILYEFIEMRLSGNKIISMSPCLTTYQSFN